jgi:hypothetical protein
MADQHSAFKDTIEALFRRFNEPVIPKESIERWLNRFDNEDRSAAISLLQHVEYHSQPRVIRETKMLHQLLLKRFAAGGFNGKTLHDVDFSREFTCKSGDVISYIYRKSNLIPTVDFKTFDELARETADDPDRFKDRILVILDDYIGTGSQFIFQFIGRSAEDIRVVNSYSKTYLACYVIHERALQNFQRLAAGRIDEVIEIEKEQFPDVDLSPEEEQLRMSLASLDWKNIELIHLEVEEPLLSPHNRTLSDDEKGRIERLFNKYKHEGYAGTSYLLGHHTFFFGAPNALPEILWPLFNRIEDISIYSGEKPAGFAEDVIRYSMDDEG